MMADVVYLDAAAAAPLAPEAFEATVEALRRVGNPGASHIAGSAAAALVNDARDAVAGLMRTGSGSVTFVGSATEANNLALRGLAATIPPFEIVTTSAEHPSVLETIRHVAGAAGQRTIGLTHSGEIDLDQVEESLSSGAKLISVHAANNETGVIQPIETIVELAHTAGALVHSDASQLMAWGEAPQLDECDLVTVSSHKMYGPQGAAALIVRPSARQHLSPVTTGGGQERGLRSGTLNVAAISGFGAAADLALKTGQESAVRVEVLRGDLFAHIDQLIDDVIEHSVQAPRRLPGVLNLAVGANRREFPDSEALLARASGIAASTGSACHVGVPGPSPVLMAMGVSEAEAERSVRLSLSRYTTRAELAVAASELGRAYRELNRLIETTESEKGQDA